MCGIAALLGEGAARERVTRMLSVAARRGPEGSRVHASAAGFVAHAALNFVDELHNQQPLLSAAGSSLVFNGEIFNWRALNQTHGLGARNDTQVLLFGLQARGCAFLSELDGQFAFIAQLSGAGGSVQTLVGRDKWGVCPLCFGYTPEGWLAIGSTGEVVEAAGVRDVKTVPAGTLGIAHANQLRFECWYRLPATARAAQRSVDPLEVRSFALQRVHSRIPDRPRDLFTTLGGIDSQFVTASVARRLHGEFGGAVTIVPWKARRPAALNLANRMAETIRSRRRRSSCSLLRGFRSRITSRCSLRRAWNLQSRSTVETVRARSVPRAVQARGRFGGRHGCSVWAGAQS